MRFYVRHLLAPSLSPGDLVVVRGQCLDRFTPNQCANDLRHHGYGQAA